MYSFFNFCGHIYKKIKKIMLFICFIMMDFLKKNSLVICQHKEYRMKTSEIKDHERMSYK